jgi:hypothetical protein
MAMGRLGRTSAVYGRVEKVNPSTDATFSAAVKETSSTAAVIGTTAACLPPRESFRHGVVHILANTRPVQRLNSEKDLDDALITASPTSTGTGSTFFLIVGLITTLSACTRKRENCTTLHIQSFVRAPTVSLCSSTDRDLDETITTTQTSQAAIDLDT